jgi:hypothetical protein
MGLFSKSTPSIQSALIRMAAEFVPDDSDEDEEDERMAVSEVLEAATSGDMRAILLVARAAHYESFVVRPGDKLLAATLKADESTVAKGGRALGFDIGPEEDAAGRAYGRVKSLVMEELKTFFRPELLNRLDEVVVFRQLDKVGGRREEGRANARAPSPTTTPLSSPASRPTPAKSPTWSSPPPRPASPRAACTWR